LNSVTSSLASNTEISYTEISDDEDEDFEDIARAIMHRVEVCVRVYILDAWEVESKDVDSPSDPYIRLKLGG